MSSTGSGPINILAQPSLAKCLRFPLRNLTKEMLRFQNLPLHPSESSVQVPIIKSLQWEICSISQTFLDMSYIASTVLSKEAPSPGSPHKAPIHRHTPFTEFFYGLWKSPVNKPPPVFPKGLLWREAHFQTAFPYISLTRAHHLYFKVQNKMSPLQLPQQGP